LLLAQPSARLVIFPEGEVYSQNASLLPYQTGAVQLALWGRDEARRGDPAADVRILPCALRYFFLRDASGSIAARMARIERRLGVERGPSDLYQRMRRLATLVLAAVEREYHLPPRPTEIVDLTPRFELAKEAALERAASLLAVPPPRGTVPERMRGLMFLAESELHMPPEGATPPEIAQQRTERARLAWRDLHRLANWVAVYDGYVSESPSQERLADVVYRLEREVCGSSRPIGPRRACLSIGEPMQLPEQAGRKDVATLTTELEARTLELLRGME
jgi:hypothetical protein